jgi:hypothetical protein
MFQFRPALSVIALVMATPLIVSAQHHQDINVMKKCAEVSVACQIECDSCFSHCLNILADGKPEHKVTAQLCADCAECCKSCATLCARNSPLAKHMMDCCAKCCDECATACEKFPKDEHMAACAKSCRDCAKQCLEMLKHDHK